MARLLVVLALMLALPARATAQIAVTSGTLVEQSSVAGQEYLTSIALYNPTSATRVARLTRTDYSAADGGQTLSAATGQQLRSNALWLNDVPATVTVPPRSTANVAVRVVVPNVASLVGTYWSAIIVETIDEAEPELQSAAEARKKSFGISMRVRYAVQVATHIGDAKAKLDFAIVRSTVDSTGRPLLELDVLNPGERGLRPQLKIELYNAAGELVSSQQQQRGLLYPGDRLRQRFRFEKLEPGEYTALVLADAGGSEVFGVQLRLRF